MFNNQSDSVVDAVTSWARVIQIGGSILGAIIMFVGFIGANGTYDDGEYRVLLSLFTGIILIVTANIASLILRLLAFIAENTSDCASSLRSCRNYMKDVLTKKTEPQKEQQKKQDEEEERAFQMRVAASSLPQRDHEPKAPAAPWVCHNCGTSNVSWDNICNNCGQKKVD